MQLSVHLADYAQVLPDGKISAIGLGWATVPSPLPAFTVVAQLELSHEEAATHSELTIRLVDGSGSPVRIAGKEMASGAHFELDPSSGPDPELPVAIPLCLTFSAGIVLSDGIYGWQVEVEGRGGVSTIKQFRVKADPRGTLSAGQDDVTADEAASTE